MGVNLYYDPATFVQPTAKLRQWRVRFQIQRDGVTSVIDELFPDCLDVMRDQGYITNTEIVDKLFELVCWAARKRLGG